jgi:TonB family protein
MNRSLLVVGSVSIFMARAALCREPAHVTGGDVLKALIYAPRIEYPVQARASRFTGSSKFLMRVHVRTGLVVEVTMVKSTGYRILDDAAIRSLRKFRFKPDALPPANVENPKHTEPWAADDSLIYFPVNFTINPT